MTAPPPPPGTPWFVLGRYDNATGAFTNTTEAQPLDSSKTVIWSTVGKVGTRRKPQPRRQIKHSPRDLYTLYREPL